MNTGIVAWSVVIAIVYAMLSKHQASYDQIIEKYSGLSIKSSMAGGIEIGAYHIFNLECKYEGKTIEILCIWTDLQMKRFYKGNVCVTLHADIAYAVIDKIYVKAFTANMPKYC